jgi:argininosuccinate lyase
MNKFASDVLLFTTSEFHYFSVKDELTTGSSIMPQKRNIDIAELIRSKVHVVLGHYTGMLSLSSNLPSGYNRDLQDAKKPLFESLEITKDVLGITKLLVESLVPNKAILEFSMTSELFATHEAFDRVSRGISFREAHHAVSKKKSINNPVKMDFLDMLKNSTHLGGTGNLQLAHIQKTIQTDRICCLNEKKQFYAALSRLGVEPVSTG